MLTLISVSPAMDKMTKSLIIMKKITCICSDCQSIRPAEGISIEPGTNGPEKTKDLPIL
ncbi:MAG: hypothetical protein JW881_08995 [Spirochaetales bacterium]|nr:hypothetical protein [Spirochaetales bacterium]